MCKGVLQNRIVRAKVGAVVGGGEGGARPKAKSGRLPHVANLYKEIYISYLLHIFTSGVSLKSTSFIYRTLIINTLPAECYSPKICIASYPINISLQKIYFKQFSVYLRGK